MVNGSLRSLRCYVLLFLLGKRSFFIDCTGFGIKSFSLRCKMWYQYQKSTLIWCLNVRNTWMNLSQDVETVLWRLLQVSGEVESLSCCFDIWHNWLLEHGVTDNHIIEIQLDNFRNRRLRKPDALLDYIDSKVVDDGKPYYLAYKSK